MTLLAAAAVIGFGIAATSTASATPVYGASAANAAAQIDIKQDVWWRGRRWCFYHPYRCR
jgi:hypothetical protein